MSSGPTHTEVLKKSNQGQEDVVKRNPHADFKAVEAARPAWNTLPIDYTRTKKPDWKFGDGATEKNNRKHVSINPYAEGRNPLLNYKLLCSAIVPRPIGFVSTLSPDGKYPNLAPFSYTMVISHDPPTFIVAFAGGYSMPRNSLINLRDTKECTINIVGEDFLEAMNSTSVDAPTEIDEWKISGLTKASSESVKPARVKESAFSVEGKLMEIKEFESRSEPGVNNCCMAIIEGVRFWIREDTLDAEGKLVDPQVLRPVARLGGITYGRISQLVETPRPSWEEVSQWYNNEGSSTKAEPQETNGHHSEGKETTDK